MAISALEKATKIVKISYEEDNSKISSLLIIDRTQEGIEF